MLLRVVLHRLGLGLVVDVVVRGVGGDDGCDARVLVLGLVGLMLVGLMLVLLLVVVMLVFWGLVLVLLVVVVVVMCGVLALARRLSLVRGHILQWVLRFKSAQDKSIRDLRAVKSPCPASL